MFVKGASDWSNSCVLVSSVIGVFVSNNLSANRHVLTYITKLQFKLELWYNSAQNLGHLPTKSAAEIFR